MIFHLLRANPVNRLLLISATMLACTTASAQAQTSTTRPMRIIVPYTAGSSADIRGRIAAQALAAQLEQPVVIDNRPGITGADILAKAAPDGHTTGFLSATVLATAKLLSANLPYDPERDYTAVALISNSPEVLVTDAKLNFNSLSDLISHAKANPVIRCASYGLRCFVQAATVSLPPQSPRS